MTNDPIDAHVEKMESAVMDARTDKDKSQMKVELKPNKAETKPRDSNKVVLCGILCLSLCANLGSLAAFFASKETCVTGLALLKDWQEVPLNTTERRRLDEEDYDPEDYDPHSPHYDPDYYYPTVCTRQPEPVLKKCAAAPTGTAEPCWELANPDMTDIPAYFLTENSDLTGTLKLGAAVRTIGTDAFYNTNLEGLDLSQAKSLVSIGNRAFENTDITGTLMIPDTVKTIADKAFYQRWSSRSKLTGLDLSNAASLESIGDNAFRYTDITGTIVTPFTIPTYDAAGFYPSFPAGVTIVSKIPGLKKIAAAPTGTEPCWELADPDMTYIPDNFLKDNTDLTGTLKLGAAVRTIGTNAFYYTNLEGLDLSQAESLVSIGNRAFGDTDITGTLMIPAKVETIGDYAFSNTEITGTLVIPANVETIGYGAFYKTNLEGLELSNADSLVSIANGAFDKTGIKGTLVIPAKVKTYAYSFPFGVTIVKG